MKLFFYGLFFLFFLMLGQTSCPNFESGNRFYLQEDYERALAEYQQCEQTPSLALFYNMGNAFYRLGDLGNARLYYEKAHLRGPFARDLSYNNKLLQQQLTDEEDDNLLKRSRKNRELELGLLWISLVFLLLAFAQRRVWGRVPLYISLLLFIGVSFLVFQHIGYQPEIGVILEKEVSLHSGPNPSAAALAKLHAGRLVSIVATENNWTLIEVKAGIRGWIPAESLGAVA